MKKILSVVLIAAFAMCVISCNEKKADTSTPLTDSISEYMSTLYGSQIKYQVKEDSTIDIKELVKGIETVMAADTSNHSYMAGIQIGMQAMGMLVNFKNQAGFEIDHEAFKKNFIKTLLADSVMDETKLQQMSMELNGMMERAARQAKENDPVAIENKKAGEAFINKKKADKSYITTKSGLVYKVLAEGAGENFKETDVIMTKYVGTHIDGKEFDNSQGEAVPFRCQGVIPGFAEILQLMKPGMKVEVVIPGDLAYGPDGRQPQIGPNETLVFVLETVEAQKVTAPDGHQVPVEVAPAQ
ncbi:FKBP-type peptidyl-prolyl cis-trans isomerase [Sodaliphilus sp.]|uniref:FKBP-type peptidyl-prolyl cis-trans isomerase n=1 Tax=Sodaliphilus sp. TaxID=2815818 RepID=UPI00388D17F4